MVDPIGLALFQGSTLARPRTPQGLTPRQAPARPASLGARKPLPAGGFKVALSPQAAQGKQVASRISMQKQLGMSPEQYSTIFGTEPEHAPAVRVAASKVAHKQTSLEEAIFGPDPTGQKAAVRADPVAQKQALEAGGLPGLPSQFTPAAGLEALRKAGEANKVGPIGSFLNVAGSVLARPESAAAFGAEAISELIKGDVGAAGRAGKHALQTLVPGAGGPVTSFSDTLRRHGVDPPTGVGPAIDIIGDPVNLVFPESIAAKPAQAAERAALKRLATEAGVPGQDVLEATIKHVTQGEQAPHFPMPEGTDTAVAAAENRVAKAQAAYDEADAAHKAAISKRATPKQVLRAERKRAKAETNLRSLVEALPGTEAQKRTYVRTFGQPATGEEAAQATMGQIRARPGGTPRQQEIYRQIFGEEPQGALTSVPTGRAPLRRGKAGGLARPTPGEIPYPIVAGHDAALAQLDRLTEAVRSYTGKQAVSVGDVMDLQRHISEMSRRIDELPGPRGKNVPRVPGTAEASQVDRAAVAGRPVATSLPEEPFKLKLSPKVRSELHMLEADTVGEGSHPGQVALGKALEEMAGPVGDKGGTIALTRDMAEHMVRPGIGAIDNTLEILRQQVEGGLLPHPAFNGIERSMLKHKAAIEEWLKRQPEVVPPAAVASSEQLPQAARLEPGAGLTGAQSRAANKMITAAQKLVKARQRSTTVPPKELIKLGQQFEAARAAFKGLTEQTRSAVSSGAAEGGRAIRGRAPAPPSPLPLSRAVGRVQGGNAGLEDVLGKAPESPPRIGSAGRRLGKREKDLQKAQQNLKTVLARQRKVGPGDFNEAQAFVEAGSVAAQAAHEAKMASPIGVRVGLGVGKYKKSVAVPLLRGDRARVAREVIHATGGEIAQRFATRYAGREHMGAAGAIQGADQWSMGRLVQGRHEVAELVRKHDLGGVANLERRQVATFVAEDSLGLEQDRVLHTILADKRIQGPERQSAEAQLARNQHLREVADDPKVKAFAADMKKLMTRLGNEAADANVLHVEQLRPDYMPIRFIPESRLGQDVVALSPNEIRIGKERFTMPGKTAMEKARKLPSAKMASDLHPGLIETDAAELMLTRLEEQTKALRDAAVERALVRHWGRVLAEGEDVPEGFVKLDGARFVPQNVVVEEAAAHTLRDLMKEAENVNIPRHLRGGLFSRLPSGRKAMSYWKRIKLLTPAYDFRNTKDDMWLALQSGVNPVAAARQGVRVLRAEAASMGRAAEGLSAAEAKMLASRLGVTGSGYVGGEITRELGRRGQTKALAQARRLPHRLRISREDAQRAGSFAVLLRKGKSPYEAAVRARAMHYAYHDPGTVVERWRSGMFGAPFMTWTTKNVPRQLKLMATRPGQFMARQRAVAALGQQAGAPLPDILAPWNQQEQPTPVPGAGWLLSRDPITDLNTMLPQGNKGGMDQFITNALGLFAPLPFAGLETASALAGKPFSLRQRQEVSDQAQADPLEARIAGMLGLGQPSSVIGQAGADVASRGVPRWFHSMYQAVNPALAGAAGRSLASAGDVRSQGLPASVLQSVTGLQFLPFNSPQDAKYAIINAQNEVQDAISKARRAGYALQAHRSKEAQMALDAAVANVQAKRVEAQRIVDEIRKAKIPMSGR